MFEVKSKQCDECLFTKNRVVSMARFRDVLRECAKSDTHFICHKATIEGHETCCRGFYDSDPYKTNLMRIAHRLNAIEFVE